MPDKGFKIYRRAGDASNNNLDTGQELAVRGETMNSESIDWE
jgi:hypothetical protein